MKLKSPQSGVMNQTHSAAFRFFHKRKQDGVALPKKKVKKADESKKLDVPAIHLDGEEDDYVPI